MDVSRLTMSSFIKLVLKDNIKFTIILNKAQVSKNFPDVEDYISINF